MTDLGAAIWIPCEGSGTPAFHHLCTMCGKANVIVDDMILLHERMDVLAMIERGALDD